MNTYKILKSDGIICAIFRNQKDSIPIEPANTDYANFKKEVLEGAELQDADGNVMSAEAAQEFINQLP